MKIRVLLSALFFCVQATCCYAQEPAHTYQPANFPADTSRIIRRINFPESEQDVLVRIFCESHLTGQGNLEGSFCASEFPDAERYILAVTARIDRGRLEPARIDGARVPVWFQYTVQFEKRDGIETIKLFPHHFVGIEGSGEGYSGPQRYRASKKPPCRAWYDLWFIVAVPAEGGRPSEIVLQNPDDDDNACADIMRGLVEDGDFIPAFLDGVAVAAPYRERWWKVLPSMPRGPRPSPPNIIVR